MTLADFLQPASRTFDPDPQPIWQVYFYGDEIVQGRIKVPEGGLGPVHGDRLPDNELYPQEIPFPWNNQISRIVAELTAQDVKRGEVRIEVRSATPDILNYRYLKHGALIRVDMGLQNTPTGDDIGPVFYGRVISFEPTFHENMVDLLITAQDLTIDLMTARVSISIDAGMNAGSAVQHIARWFFLDTKIAPNPPVIAGTGHVDAGVAWAVLVRIAERVGWKIWFTNATIFFMPEPTDITPILHLEYGGGSRNVFSARIREDRTNAIGASETANVDDSTGQVISAQSPEPGITVPSPVLTEEQIKLQVQTNVRSALQQKSVRQFLEQFSGTQDLVIPNRATGRLEPAEDFLTDYYTRFRPDATDRIVFDDIRQMYNTVVLDPNQTTPLDQIFDLGKMQRHVETTDPGWWTTKSQPDIWSYFSQRLDPTTGMLHVHPDPHYGWPVRIEPVMWEYEDLADTQEEAEYRLLAAAKIRGFPQELEVETIGEWVARPHQNIQIRGLHRIYDGPWHIKDVRHEVSERYYRINITAKRGILATLTGILDWNTMIEKQRQEKEAEKVQQKTEAAMEVVNGTLRSVSSLLHETQVDVPVIPPSDLIRLEPGAALFPPKDRPTSLDRRVKFDDFTWWEQRTSSEGFRIYTPERRIVQFHGRYLFMDWPESTPYGSRRQDYVVVMLDAPGVPDVVKQTLEPGVGYVLETSEIPALEAMLQKIRQSSEELPDNWQEAESQE